MSFNRRIFFRVRIVEGSRRRCVEDQREIGLFCQPFQHIRPTLKTKIKTEPWLRGHFGEQDSLLIGQYRCEEAFAVNEDFGAICHCGFSQGFGPLSDQRRNLGPLFVRQLQRFGQLGFGQTPKAATIGELGGLLRRDDTRQATVTNEESAAENQGKQPETED